MTAFLGVKIPVLPYLPKILGIEQLKVKIRFYFIIIKIFMTMSRKVILYIAASLDGYIAAPDDNLDFLKLVEMEGEDYGYFDFVKTVDTVIMGRRTYDHVLSFGIGFPHADKRCYVLSRSKSGQKDEYVNYFDGDLVSFVRNLKREPGMKNIFIDGGAQTVHALLKAKLIDELIISVIPVLLGEGVRLFDGGEPAQRLKISAAKKFDSGLVQLHYIVEH